MDPINKAIRLSAVYAGLAAAVFLLLALVVYAVPGQLTYNLDEPVSKGKSWLPDKEIVSDALPEKESFSDTLLWAGRFYSTNVDLSQNYADPKAMLERFKAWGRLEGYTHRFISRERCRSVGPRTIRLRIDLYKNDSGAQAFFKWLEENPSDEWDLHHRVDIGDVGYLNQGFKQSFCGEGDSELKLEATFRRDSNSQYGKGRSEA